MSTNILVGSQPVTLSIEEANFLLDVMRDLIRADSAHARKTKSAAIRANCEYRAQKLHVLADEMTRRLYNVGVANRYSVGLDDL